jgi:serine/threonine protein kinase
MLSYDDFLCVTSRADPRSVLLFASDVDTVLAHIIASSHEIQSNVVVIPDDGEMTDVFVDAVNHGWWLVVRKLSDVSFDEWRDVGAHLATMLPSGTFHARKNFKLFTFAPSVSINLRLFAPQLLCQFVLIIDHDGTIHGRSDLSPIFLGDTTFDATSDKLPITSLLPESGRAEPYLLKSAVRQRTAGTLEAKVPATNIDFVDETLCALREELEERQKHLIDAALERSEEPKSETNDPTIFGSDESEKDRVHQKEEARRSVVKFVEQDYDWIFPRIVEWAIHQCPDVEALGVNQIQADEVEAESVAWRTATEVCEFGTWGSCDVLIKTPLMTMSSVLRNSLRAAFQKEAARHFSLRHPRVITMFGMRGDSMVLERARGTLEQFLVKKRGDARRLQLVELLRIFKQVMEGLAYLNSQLVHRDVACRSVLEISEGEFKIGQFLCAMPHQTSDLRESAIPVRWTSPEGLVGVFSEKSDVWSFGVLAWEAFHYCSTIPYAENVQAASVIAMGMTLGKPPSCPKLVWEDILAPCFTLDADQRPTSKQLLAKLERALNKYDHSFLVGLAPLPDEKLTFEQLNNLIL